MLKVYQIRPTDAEIDLINRGELTSPRIKAYYTRMSGQVKLDDVPYYEHVANVMTNDMEEAFRLMNLWDDKSKVEKFGRCSSLSVGDIIEQADGRLYVCASFGFEPLDLPVHAA